MASAYLLVSHGSRDPRPQVAMEQLAKMLVHQKLAQIGANQGMQSAANTSVRSSANARLTVPLMAEILVETAYLELCPAPLHEQIKNFGDRAAARGCDKLQVVPLFLLAGTHVMEDIPAQVAIARQALGQAIKVELRPYLGTHPGLSQLLANQIAVSEKIDVWILLAHGSRRAGSKQPIEMMATQLGAVSAYWAVAPSLESCIKELVAKGYRRIGVLPYFLFAGGITDAIAFAVEELKVQFADVSFYMAEPMGASIQLAGLIWDLVEE